MTPEKPQQVLTKPNDEALPPVFAQDPLGKKPKGKSSTPTFLGTGTTPAATGGAQLTGQ